jgi:Fe2+ or Zn2+ uptake regulation protein
LPYRAKNYNRKVDSLILALTSKTRRKILKSLIQGPRTVKEIFQELADQGFKLKYPESAYKALQLLVDCGLVEKYYEQKRGLLYRLIKTKIEIDFSEL